MNPTKSNGLDAANIQPADATHLSNSADFKDFHELVRAFALRGHTLIRTKQGFTAIRWNLAKHFASRDEALEFLHRIGGKP
jgi:hypothetical protein